MPLAFHHLALQCADLDRCERFYTQVLGLPVLRRWPAERGGDRSVWLAVGEQVRVVVAGVPAAVEDHGVASGAGQTSCG